MMSEHLSRRPLSAGQRSSDRARLPRCVECFTRKNQGVFNRLGQLGPRRHSTDGDVTISAARPRIGAPIMTLKPLDQSIKPSLPRRLCEYRINSNHHS